MLALDIAWTVVFVLGPFLVLVGGACAAILALSTRRTHRRAAESGSPVVAATILAAARATTTNVTAWTLALVTALTLLLIGAIALGPITLAPRWAGHSPDSDYWMLAWNPVPLALTPAGVALAFLAVLLAGEATWRTSDGTVRRAGLAARTTSSIAPALLRRATWAWTALLVVAALVGGLTATRSGALQRSVAAPRAGFDDLVELLTATPYPSWAVGVPLTVGALALVGGVELVLHRITSRPAVDGVDPAWDLALRRLTAHRALRLPQLVAGLALSVVLCWLGSSFLTVQRPAPGWALVTIGVTVGVAALALALVPARPLPRVGPDASPAPQPVAAPQGT
ncbi:hypothetical protein [Oerskovia turbata]